MQNFVHSPINKQENNMVPIHVMCAPTPNNIIRITNYVASSARTSVDCHVEKKVGDCLFITWKWSNKKTSMERKMDQKKTLSPKLSLSYILRYRSSNPKNPLQEFVKALLLNESNHQIN